MNWAQLEKLIPRPTTHQGWNISGNKIYGAGGGGGSSFTSTVIDEREYRKRSILDLVHKKVQLLRHVSELPLIWPARYHLIAHSPRMADHLRHEHHLSPLELHPAQDISHLCGLDQQNNYIVLGPGFLDSTLFRGSLQNPLEILNELCVRFGDHVVVYDEPTKKVIDAQW